MLRFGMRIRATSMLVPVVLSLALGLSACGSSSLRSAVDPVAVAAEKTVAAKTVDYSMTVQERVLSLPAPVSITAEGAMDFANHRMSMSMDMSQLAALGGEALGSPSDWKIEAVIDGLVMYMKAPFLQTLLKSDEPWIKLDLGSIGKQQGLDLSSLMSYEPSQFLQVVDYLRGSKDMQVIDHESVRGVATAHYRGSVDFDAYLRALPADQRLAAKQAQDELNQAGKPVYGLFDVWIDGQQRVRRERFDYSIGAASGGSVDVEFSIDFFDYDVPISVAIPPADQTIDLGQLESSLGTG
jgi:hypothetical protein